MCGIKVNATENFITPTTAGLQVNGQLYTLSIGQDTQLLGFPNGCSVELLNISYLPIEHIVSFHFFGNKTSTTTIAAVKNTLNITVALGSANTLKVNAGTYNSFVNVVNVITPLTAPPGYIVLSIYNVTVSNTLNFTEAHLTESYTCGVSNVEPFIFEGGTWTEITPFTINASACTISFKIPTDPIIGIFAIAPPKTTTTLPSTTSASTSTIPPALPGKATASEYTTVIALVVIAVILAILAYALSRPKPKKQQQKRGSGRGYQDSS